MTDLELEALMLLLRSSTAELESETQRGEDCRTIPSPEAYVAIARELIRRGRMAAPERPAEESTP